MRALLDEASARIALALDSVAERTPEVQALADFYDRLNDWCWCAAPHRGGCPDDATVVARCDADAEALAADRANP